MSAINLKLFVTDRSPVSQRAVHRLRQVCEQHFRNRYRLDIIDVLAQPEQAEDQKILATPTLLCAGIPGRLVGDLSDESRVREWLGALTGAEADAAIPPEASR